MPVPSPWGVPDGGVSAAAPSAAKTWACRSQGGWTSEVGGGPKTPSQPPRHPISPPPTSNPPSLPSNPLPFPIPPPIALWHSLETLPQTPLPLTTPPQNPCPPLTLMAKPAGGSKSPGWRVRLRYCWYMSSPMSERSWLTSLGAALLGSPLSPSGEAGGTCEWTTPEEMR